MEKPFESCKTIVLLILTETEQTILFHKNFCICLQELSMLPSKHGTIRISFFQCYHTN